MWTAGHLLISYLDQKNPNKTSKQVNKQKNSGFIAASLFLDFFWSSLILDTQNPSNCSWCQHIYKQKQKQTKTNETSEQFFTCRWNSVGGVPLVRLYWLKPCLSSRCFSMLVVFPPWLETFLKQVLQTGRPSTFTVPSGFFGYPKYSQTKERTCFDGGHSSEGSFPPWSPSFDLLFAFWNKTNSISNTDKRKVSLVFWYNVCNWR